MRGMAKPAFVAAAFAFALMLPAHPAVAKFAADSSTILTDNAAKALERQCSRVRPGPVASLWTPSTDEIADLEGRLEPLLDAKLAANGIPADQMAAHDYYRQYAGFVIGGRHVIYVNGLYKSTVGKQPGLPLRANWHKQAIGICDGGPITFGVEYDVETRTLSNFSFNGQV